ncbi:MAG: hypothetical protein AAFR59_06580 [Bacteroidota bacterium]
MKIRSIFLILMILLIAGVSIASYPEARDPIPEDEDTLAETQTTDDESLTAFNKMMDVLTHQRCLNCHPSDNVPKQGEDSHPHRFDITRENASGAATNCNTCHQASNNDFSGVPGAPEWSLAPHSMRWEGLSRIEIAQSMMNRANNGNRSAADIMHHLTEHELVLWAWEPGIDAAGNERELPPVPKDEYIAAVKKWIELGAVIPQE